MDLNSARVCSGNQNNSLKSSEIYEKGMLLAQTSSLSNRYEQSWKRATRKRLSELLQSRVTCNLRGAPAQGQVPQACKILGFLLGGYNLACASVLSLGYWVGGKLTKRDGGTSH